MRNADGGKPWTMAQTFEFLRELTEAVEPAGTEARESFRIDQVQTAIGMLLVGQMYGYVGLRTTSASATIKRSEGILANFGDGFPGFRQVLPERTPNARNIRGVRMSDAYETVWAYLRSGPKTSGENRMIDAVPA
jgi:hypothetical protein